jgi:DedD protein
MTCHDAREQLSALLDDVLAAPERGALDAHLAACAECRRELEQLRATIALLDRVPPAHAPTGFVDRVMAEAYRPSWPRRILDALFVPVRVKLPLEAVAVLLVSVSALYVYQRTPEVRELDRQAARAPAPVAPAPPAEPSPPAPGPTATRPGPAAPTPAAKEPAAGVPRVPARPQGAREEPRITSPDVGAPASPSPSTSELRDAPAVPGAKALGKEAKEEAPADRRADAPASALSAAAPERAAKSGEAAAPSDAAGSRSDVARAKPAAPPAGAPPVPESRGGAAGIAPGPPVPSAERAPGPPPGAARAPVARQLMRAVDASGRLTVPARVPAEQALDALLGRLGGARVGRLLEGDRGIIVIDVLVPGARYPELIEGLGRIGRWVTEYESATFPAQVRVEVALTVEP